MVSSCIVPRCKRGRRTGLSYYRFPVKDAERCKLWLRAVNNPKYDEDTAVDCLRNHRVCSLHFKPDDFERHLVWEAMGGDGVKKLRPTAVPSRNLDHGETSTRAEHGKVSSATAQASAKVLPGPSVTSMLPWASVPSGAPSTSSCSPSPPAKLWEGLCSSSVNHLNETVHQETELSSTMESTSDETTDGHLSQCRTIVNDSCLMDLFRKCQTCGQSINNKKVSQCGAQKKVRWSCLGGHRGIWMSSPYLWEACPEIHFLTTLSIIFSGGTFVQFKKWAKHLHLNFMANKTFAEIQKAYLNPETKRTDTAGLERHQQHEAPYVEITDNGHCVSHGFILTRTEKDPLKKIKSNLQRRNKAASSVQSSFEKSCPVLSTTSGACEEEVTASSNHGLVSSSETGNQQEYVEHLGRARPGATEVKCLQDRCKLEGDMGHGTETSELIAPGAGGSCHEDVYVPVIPQRSAASELLLECEEEDLEPWQKQTSQVDLKNEDNLGQSTNEDTDCKLEPVTPPRYATCTPTPALKPETPPAVIIND